MPASCPSIELNAWPNTRTSLLPAGMTRTDRSPCSARDAARESAMSGRIIRRALRAVRPTSRTVARICGPTPNDSRRSGISPATIKNGIATASRLSSILAKKLFQSAPSRRPEEAATSSGGASAKTRTLGRVLETAGGLAGFLSSTVVLGQALPAGAGNVVREGALAGGGGGDLLGRDRHPTAALRDMLHGEHDLLGRAALLLGGDLDPATPLGHGPHHLQPP